jgi:predicted dehydrogenase
MKHNRRDFLLGLATIPFLGYFAFNFRRKIAKEIGRQPVHSLDALQIDQLDAPMQKLHPPTGKGNRPLRIGLIGNGWRGEDLMQHLGFVHPEVVEKNKENGEYTDYFRRTYVEPEDFNVVIAAVCDVFDVHAKRGIEISQSFVRGNKNFKPAKRFRSYRDMIPSGEIDAIIIATPDHTHAPIAIEAAKAGLAVYLEKPMAHSIEHAVELKKTIRETGVVFQLGHQNHQQMSYKIANELYRKGVLGDVSMVQAYTNRNTIFGAWIRDDAFDHKLGNEQNIDWKEFLSGAPWHAFDRQRFFSWQRYSDYGTSLTGNDFTHRYDAINQILELGIPESVVAAGGQYYYKHHGDMPDVFNAVFNYPQRGLTISYDASLKNDMYQQIRILGSEATMDIDRSIFIHKGQNTRRYQHIETMAGEPLYYYDPKGKVDAVTSATSQVYLKSGYGPTYMDGEMINTSFLHLKEWIDAIRGIGEPSCNIDLGFQEAVTFNLANLAYVHKKRVIWDGANEKALFG